MKDCFLDFGYALVFACVIGCPFVAYFAIYGG